MWYLDYVCLAIPVVVRSAIGRKLCDGDGGLIMFCGIERHHGGDSKCGLVFSQCETK